jgi:hypothetical protein
MLFAGYKNIPKRFGFFSPQELEYSRCLSAHQEEEQIGFPTPIKYIKYNQRVGYSMG